MNFLKGSLFRRNTEPENSGETAEGTESKESEGAELSAESGATE